MTNRSIKDIENDLHEAYNREFKEWLGWDSLYLSIHVIARSTSDYGKATEWLVRAEPINMYRPAGHILKNRSFKFSTRDSEVDVKTILERFIVESTPPEILPNERSIQNILDRAIHI